MNKAWAERWATYLENPHLRQAKEHLCSGDGRARCCLGHAEAMLGRQFKRHPVRQKHDPNPDLLYPYDPVTKTVIGQAHWLLKDTMDLLGLRTSTGEFANEFAIIFKGENCRSLAKLNDTGMPLQEIAAVIREHWEKL